MQVNRQFIIRIIYKLLYIESMFCRYRHISVRYVFIFKIQLINRLDITGIQAIANIIPFLRSDPIRVINPLCHDRYRQDILFTGADKILNISRFYQTESNNKMYFQNLPFETDCNQKGKNHHRKMAQYLCNSDISPGIEA